MTRRTISALAALVTGAALLTVQPAQATTWDSPGTMVPGGIPVVVNGLSVSEVARSGRSLVAWTEVGGTGDYQLFATTGNGSTYRVARVLSTGSAGSPAVALSPSGRRGIVAWSQYEAATRTTTVRAATLRGNRFGRATVITRTRPGGSVYGPALAHSADLGRAAIGWQHTSGAEKGYYLRRWDGGSWSAPRRLNRNGGLLGAPALAMSPDGRQLDVAMLRGGGVNLRIEAVRMTGRRVAGRSVLGSGYASAGTPMLARSDDGRAALVAWTSYSGSVPRIRSAMLAGGRWSRPTPVSGTGAVNPHVDLSGDGRRGLLTWTVGDFDADNLVQARRVRDGRWLSTRTLSTTANRSSQAQTLSADGRRATVIWSTWTGTAAAQARTLTGSRWSAVTALDTGGPGRGYVTDVAGSADGRSLVAWWTRDWNPGSTPPEIGLQWSRGRS